MKNTRRSIVIGMKKVADSFQLKSLLLYMILFEFLFESPGSLSSLQPCAEIPYECNPDQARQCLLDYVNNPDGDL